MKKTVLVLLILMTCVSLFGCANKEKDIPASGQINVVDMETALENLIVRGPKPQETAVVYTNTEYGFTFTLPASWKGYTIVTGTWEGLPIGGETPVETGPMISIRHPLWTEAKPRQDIPIMVFTIKQWNALQAGEFHIGAAPIGPSGLGRNSEYVFALPARYNYAFPTGYEEVEDILKGKPLKPIEPTSALSQ